MEWNSPWNSFNSWKGLTYWQNYQSINDWRLGKINKPLPPIEISLDLILNCQLKCSFCFEENSEVILPDLSSKKIKDIKIGDKILGCEKKDKPNSPLKLIETEVVRVFNNGITNEMLEIEFTDGDKILCTENHKLRDYRRWKLAKNFKPGDLCRKFLTHSRKIKSIKKIKGNFSKYDLETKTHNYFVSGQLVHNCNTGKYLEEKGLETLSRKHLFSLLRFFSKWGTKAICFGGGGESTLHPDIWDALLLSKKLNLENAIATNGIAINSYEKAEVAVKTCRWLGVSVDAATAKTYKELRNIDLFDKVISNIERLVRAKKDNPTVNCDVAYKFLLFQENQHEIFEAAKLAKQLGVRDFHVRPADTMHQGMLIHKNTGIYDINIIKEQFQKCHELADEKFRVFTVTHKFNDDFSPKRNFSQCYGSPLGLQICPDNGIYLCPDTRRLGFYKLGEHYPDPKNIERVWGSKKHYDLVFKTGCQNCKSRCTFSPYCEQCEKLAIDGNDPFCRNFI